MMGLRHLVLLFLAVVLPTEARYVFIESSLLSERILGVQVGNTLMVI